jgi:hypothetical protein
MKGILFKPDMIQAIIEGRKTQTRRVIKPQRETMDKLRRLSPLHITYDGDSCWNIKPRYQVGEIVYIKEAFCHSCAYICFKLGYEPIGCTGAEWKSPLFLKQVDARYFLVITDVRVERLQEISIDDIKSEGIIFALPPLPYDPLDPQALSNKAYLDEFIILWNSINREKWESNPWVFVYTFKQIRRR